MDHIVAMASSIVSSIQLPEASEAGLFNTPHRARRRNYQLLDGSYTLVSGHVSGVFADNIYEGNSNLATIRLLYIISVS